MARNEFIRVRVSAEEKEIINQKALSSYRTPSDYVRECCLDKEIIVLDGLHELVTELRRQGHNLNQLTVMARQERISFVGFEQFEEVYRQAWDIAFSSCVVWGLIYIDKTPEHGIMKLKMLNKAKGG